MKNRKKFKNKFELKEYLKKDKEFISPNQISLDHAVLQNIAWSICEELTVDGYFTKCIELECPQCGASTGMGGDINSEDVADLLDEYLCCESCPYESEANDFVQKVYFKNNFWNSSLYSNKKDLYSSRQSELDLLGKKTKDVALINTDESIIWHISDCHFGTKPLPGSPNHCNERINRFIEIVKKRKERIGKDIFIISGDLTTNGSKENLDIFENFILQLISEGVHRDNILIVPGNHDAWFGSSQLKVMLEAFLMWSKFKKVKKINNWTQLLQNYNLENFFNIQKNVNGLNVEFKLVDSTILKNISQGAFPEVSICKDFNPDLKILILHHHIIDLRDSWSGTSEMTESFMSLRNADFLHRWLRGSGVKIVLHGHKHVQFFSHDLVEDFHIIAAPSLCENKKPEYEWKIGFNLLILKKDHFDLYFNCERNGEFIINQALVGNRYF